MKVRIQGLRETLRAFDYLSKQASNELRDASTEIAEGLAVRVRRAGTRLGGQPRLVASKGISVKRDRAPVLAAGLRGGKKVKALLFGAEFGMNRKTGWYRKVRYFDSRGYQFGVPHQGRDGRFFFPTVEYYQDEVSDTYGRMADKLARDWAER